MRFLRVVAFALPLLAVVVVTACGGVDIGYLEPGDDGQDASPGDAESAVEASVPDARPESSIETVEGGGDACASATDPCEAAAASNDAGPASDAADGA